jgi:undecaprenyl-diphosphatase
MPLLAGAGRGHRAGRQTRSRRAGAVPERPRPIGDRTTVALRLAGGAVALWALICVTGLLLTHVVDLGRAHSADLGVDKWFAVHRTGLWNGVTLVGTSMAQTETAIGVAIAVVLLLRWRLGRWYESWVLITVMAGEILVFFGVTEMVHRPRPHVARLDAAPPTSSFPSGHTAAAVALYGCIAVLVLCVYGRRRATWTAVALLSCVPVFVGLSRLYRGMHFPTDVLAGALMGGLWLLLVVSTLLPRQAALRSGAATRRAVTRPRAATRPRTARTAGDVPRR